MTNIITSLTPRKFTPIPDVIKITLWFIYDEKNCPYSKSDVEGNINQWVDWVQHEKDRLRDLYGKDYIDGDSRPMGTKGTTLDETEFWLCWCAKRLVEDEEYTGEVARNKRDILMHGTDWRKLYRLPGSVTAKDMAKAMYHLKQAVKDHPEDYE
jgi:hypothetical protein